MEAKSPQQNALRLFSLDAYRGFAMFLMAAEMMHLTSLVKHFPDSRICRWLAFHCDHVDWAGCSLHDLIQPSFSFMVGVALPFSLASRASRGQSCAKQWLHVMYRSLILILLGVFLRSTWHDRTDWTFEDTLSQIGLGYPFLFALGLVGNRLRWASLVAILVGYWLFFVFYTPPQSWDAGLARVPRGWSHDFTGFASHWNFNKNPAWAFDRWFMNLFPRKNEFMGNSGAYSTLSFIPTLGTMVLGLIAGQWLRDRNSNAEPLRKLIIAGTICMATGILLDKTGICPSVKKIWTPSWTLFSGGWCFFLMSAFYALIDYKGWKKWALPLVVIGTNSIAMYVMVYTQTGFFRKAITTHFGRAPFRVFGDAFEQTLHGAAVLLLLWLILFWLYRRKVFLKI